MEVFSDSVTSSTLYIPSSSPPSPTPIDSSYSVPPEIEALRRLSFNVSSLFLNSHFSDFTITTTTTTTTTNQTQSLSLALHRCILSSRSHFFHHLFTQQTDQASAEILELGQILGPCSVEVGYDALVLVLGYVYSGTVGPLPRGVCECADEEGCSHVGCRPAVEFMLQVLLVAFRFEIWELVSLFQRHLLRILGKVEIDDIPVILCIANMCSKACTKLLTECIEIVVNSDLDVVTLEKALPQDVVKQIMDSRTYPGLNGQESTDFPDIHTRRIHRALDSDDIELVKLLLEEGHATLDNAYALHYAVACCNQKITAELLNLGCADVNHRNLRGYTVLHIAAIRKELEIIVNLLDKGARPCDLTLNGRKAIQISKRLTKAIDYYRPFEQGKDSPKDRLCIEVLEQAERRDPPITDASDCLTMAASELHQNLLYLEARVGLAKLLYPMEARVAMVNAHVDGTKEFTMSDLSTRNRGTTVILNEMNLKIKEEHIIRMRALAKTVELGKRYFPRCSEVLSKIVDDDSSERSSLEHNTTEGRKKRYLELQEEVMKAFLEDKEELDGSVLCSSSSKSVGKVRTKSAKKC